MDDREKLMELCRYYKGEKENPYKGEQNKACFQHCRYDAHRLYLALSGIENHIISLHCSLMISGRQRAFLYSFLLQGINNIVH